MISLSDYQQITKLSRTQKEKFGQVYLVKSNSNNEKFVLKTLSKSASSLALSLLKNESQFTFIHPQVQHSLKYWETEDTCYLLKSYHEGMPIDSYFSTLKKLDRQLFLIHLTHQLNTLLQTIHHNGIIHSDLKPSNLLVDASGQVKLIDFGLAIRKDSVVEARPTLFSLGYAAPEIVLNQWSLVDEAADYFSIGVVYYRLLSGELPWKHPNPSILTNLQITYPLPEHSNITKKLHQLLANLTYKHTFQTSPSKMTVSNLQVALIEGKTAREKSLLPLLAYFEQINQKKSIWSWFKS